MKKSQRCCARRVLLAIAFLTLISMFTVSTGMAAKYPAKPIEILVPWAQGGTVDRNARAFQPLFEKELGATTYLKNMGGASGAVGTEYVYGRPADGYTIMVSSYQPAGVFQVMDLSKLGLADFETIALISFTVPVVTVHKDAKWKNVQELVEDAKKSPGEITLGYAGPATMGQICGHMLEKHTGAKFNMVPFSGGGPVVTATLGRHVDVNIQSLTENMDQYLAGNFRLLGTFSGDVIKGLEDVPPLGKVFPNMEPYLPWGQWIGVMVHKDTPEEIVTRLREVTKSVLAQDEWAQFLERMCSEPLALIGDDASDYLNKWESVTSWLLFEAGVAQKSPEEFGIPKP